MDALARMLPSLAVIVGALLLLRHWARRSGRAGGSPLRVVSRAGIGKGSLVAVVEVEGRRLLVGAGEHGVRLLTDLEASAEELPAPDPPPAADLPEAVVGPTPATPPDDPLPPDPLTSDPTHDRPRMAPIDRLRAMTVRQPVASHRPRPTRVHHRT